MQPGTIQSILDEAHDILSRAVGPNNRREYMRANNIHGDINWHFTLTAPDIIRNRIPSNVIGCTGRAKLFCHLAKQHGVACNVVIIANIRDLQREHDAARGTTPDNTHIIINGHQIISTDTPDGPRMFDPGARQLNFLTEQPHIGGIVDIGGSQDFIIRALVPGDKFMSLSSYWELDNMYRNGDAY